MNVAIIPARKGSKRIPNKNRKLFFGKPIIYWTIKKTIDSKLFDKVVVSTDCKKIAKIANNQGAETPFLRKKIYSGDNSTISEVINNAIKNLQFLNWRLNSICCILPTAPSILKKDLKKAKKIILSEKKINYVFSATKYSYNVYRSFKIKKNKIKMIFPNNYSKKSQLFDETFHDAGQFYWAKVDTWSKQKKVFDNNSKIVEIPSWRVQDIDTMDDWKRAENIFKLIQNKNEKSL